MQNLVIALLALVSACGGAAVEAPARNANAEPPPRWTQAPIVAFRVTLPSGIVIALDDEGTVSIDGEPVGTLEADGRIEDLDGETLAALLPDGRISYRGELIGARVVEGRLVEGDVATLEIDEDESIHVRGTDGRELASVPVLGVTEGSRATVLFVVGVRLLVAAQASDEELREQIAGTADGADGRIRVPIDGRPTRGPETALVTIAMFSDFQCPFCSRVLPTLAQIEEQYGDRVRFVYFQRPLPFHDRAEPAAMLALEALAQQGPAGFWAMHDVLFENQRALDDASLDRYAAARGLDAARARAAIDDRRHAPAIAADVALAERVGARGTPSFFINGTPLVGAQPVEEFRAVIDRELALAERLVRRGVPPARVYATLMEGAREDAPEAAPSPSRARPRPDPSAIYRVPIDGAAARGPADALVTIVIFSDFQCPFCSRVLPTLERIEETYGRDVRFVYRHNPLPFHEHAMPAAEAAAEALAQRGPRAFWAMHDLLFENQQALERADLERYATELRLDMRRFRRALDEHTHRAEIEADQALARELGASGTPSFFINGQNLRGAQPFEAFQTAVDAALARARERVAAGTPRARVYEELTRDGARAPVMLPGDAASDAPAEAPPDADRVYTIAVPRGAPARGPASAAVTIQLFSDFQCPFCARLRPTLERILETYGSRVRVVWRNYPLPFHQYAQGAAEAAMEIHAQRGADAFWRYHDILFENQRALEPSDLESYARQIPGIDLARFRAAMADHRHAAAIRADMDAVRAAGAEIGTPSLFIDGRLIQGAQPFEAFRVAIDRALED